MNAHLQHVKTGTETLSVSVCDCLTCNRHLSRGNLHCVRGVWPNTIVRGSQGAEGVFGLGRIIHSPLKRIGESHRLWWVVSWCLFRITRTWPCVSQPGHFGINTVPQRASWMTVMRWREWRKREQEVEEGGRVIRMFWCLCCLSLHRSRVQRDDVITEAQLTETQIL